jgi:hypothetical protein
MQTIEANFNLRRIGLSMLAAGALLVSHQTQDAVASPVNTEPTATLAGSPLPSPENQLTRCVEPTNHDFQAVGHLLRQPVAKAFRADPNAPEIGPNSTEKEKDAADKYNLQQEKTQQDFVKNVALKYGLETHDGNHYVRLMQEGLKRRDGSSASVASLLSTANAFLEKYGLEVGLATAKDHIDLGGRPLTASEIETSNVRSTLINIVSAYSNMPKEYIELSGLKRIVLATGIDAQAYAPATMKHDEIVININNDPTAGSVSEHTVRHEEYHQYDLASCSPSDQAVDLLFQGLNDPKHAIYGKGIYDTADPNLLDFNYGKGLEAGKLFRLEQIDDVANYCKILHKQRVAAGKLLSYSQYHPDVIEEKAEFGAEISDQGSYIQLDDPSLGIVYKKFKFLLARLHHQNPGIADFFIRTSYRPVPEDYEKHCK